MVRMRVASNAVNPFKRHHRDEDSLPSTPPARRTRAATAVADSKKKKNQLAVMSNVNEIQPMLDAPADSLSMSASQRLKIAEIRDNSQFSSEDSEDQSDQRSIPSHISDDDFEIFPPSHTLASGRSTEPNSVSLKSSSSIIHEGNATIHPPNFTNPYHKARYEALLLHKVSSSKFFDFELLHVLKVDETVMECFANIGWSNLLSLPHECYLDLCLEFFASFTFTIPSNYTLATPGLICFQLMGEAFELSINEFNYYLRMLQPDNWKNDEHKRADCVVPVNFKDSMDAKCCDLSDVQNFNPGVSKSWEINDHALQLCHRFIAYIIFSRKDGTNVVSTPELFILCSMRQKRRLNFRFMLAANIRHIVSYKTRALAFGPFVTLLASTLKSFKPNECVSDSLFKARYFNTSCLQTMKILELDSEGNPYFCTPGVKTSSEILSLSTGAPVSSQDNTVSPQDPNDVAKRLDRIEAALKAYFDHIGFKYQFPN
ncbi:hypothetical protein C2S52_014017 [Perilla frutescens var. hirtella]|nr:hypothetical protein C2S52_014017 [Perilla frutescens var. hirtella]